MSNRETFRGIFMGNKWAGSESVSGPGSTRRVTDPIRRALPVLIRGLGVRTFLDAPCGDYGWMRHVELDVDRYIGVDVVPELVSIAEASMAPGREFRVADITADPLPRADMIHCRDCLVHMADDLAVRAIANMKASGSTFFLSTTFYAMTANAPGSTGGWRPINLQIPPFNLPPPMLVLPERQFAAGEHSDKSLGLWKFEDIP